MHVELEIQPGNKSIFKRLIITKKINHKWQVMEIPGTKQSVLELKIMQVPRDSWLR